MLDTADTEEKAKELKAMYEARYIECKFKDPNTKTRFVYFWWDHPLTPNGP
jgi:ABC-type Fe3+-hydroxamate transport system substrate-binding protein